MPLRLINVEYIGDTDLEPSSESLKLEKVKGDDITLAA